MTVHALKGTSQSVIYIEEFQTGFPVPMLLASLFLICHLVIISNSKRIRDDTHDSNVGSYPD